MPAMTTFLEEAHEGLNLWERSLLGYGQVANTMQAFNVLFRIAHNLKGSALIVGLKELGGFLHIVEDALTELKSGERHNLQSAVTALLEVHSLLTEWLPFLRNDRSYIPPRYEEVLSHLKPFQIAPILEPNLQGFNAFEVSAEIIDLQAAAKIAEQTPMEAPVPVANASEKLKPAAPGPEQAHLRVPLQKLDGLLNLLGELVVDQAIMQRHRTTQTTSSADALRIIAHMGKTIQEIQSIGMTLRMMPLDVTFQKISRASRTTASKLNKKVEVVLLGSEVELDKVIVDRLSEPLIHMVNNALDHGIETEQERLASHKAPIGVLTISAKQKDSEVVITIADDGRGLDPDQLTQRAIEKGLLAENAKLSREDAFALIFEPGFSTKTEVTQVSGRGVGMDVVNTVIRDLKGVISIESQKGKGTTFTLTLPLSLSIIQGLVIGVRNQKYVIPLNQLVETIDTEKLNSETVRGKGRILNLRGEVIPFVNLATLLSLSTIKLPNESDSTLGIVANCRGRKIGFALDTIVGQQSVVLKGFPPQLQDLPGIIGGAILSDGEPALVLNLGEFSSAWSSKNVA